MRPVEWNAARAFWATWRTGDGVRVNVSINEGLGAGMWRVEAWAGDRAGVGPVLTDWTGGLREAKRLAIELGLKAEKAIRLARGGR